MRFSSTALLALPLLASAAESPFEQYKAKFQNFLGSLGASTGGAPKAADAPAAAAVPNAGTAKAAKSKNVEPKPITSLTLNTWKDTLYAPVKAGAAQPEEWLVMVTGGNKTCFGRCDRINTAFADAATPLASPASPSLHLATLNCEEEPVLCNSWSANTGGLWLFEVVPAPAPVDIYTRRMNLTTVTTQDIVDAYRAPDREAAGWHLYDPNGFLHPLEGKLAKLGLSVPLGYFFWALNAMPSWGLMLIVSFVSRSMMNRRVDGMGGRPGAPGAAGAPRAAPPGDGRS